MAGPDVANGVRVQMRICIEGGGLRKDSSWVPRQIHNIGGLNFLELSRADRKLQKFVGCSRPQTAPLASCSFFESLIADRNQAVDALLVQKMLAEDMLLTPEKAKSLKLLRECRRTLDPMEIDPFTEVFCSFTNQKIVSFLFLHFV